MINYAHAEKKKTVRKQKTQSSAQNIHVQQKEDSVGTCTANKV